MSKVNWVDDYYGIYNEFRFILLEKEDGKDHAAFYLFVCSDTEGLIDEYYKEYFTSDDESCARAFLYGAAEDFVKRDEAVQEQLRRMTRNSYKF